MLTVLLFCCIHGRLRFPLSLYQKCNVTYLSANKKLRKGNSASGGLELEISQQILSRPASALLTRRADLYRLYIPT